MTKPLTEKELAEIESWDPETMAEFPSSTREDIQRLVAEVRRLRAVLQRIADSDHPEDGGPECGHPDVAEEALRNSSGRPRRH